MDIGRSVCAALLTALVVAGGCSSENEGPVAGPVIPEPDDAIVSCGEEVPYARLLSPEPVDTLDPAWLAVQELIAAYPGELGYLPTEGWIVMRRTDDEAVFGILTRGDADLRVDAVEASYAAGEWHGAGSVSGQCRLRVVLPEGLAWVDWELDNRQPTPGPAATRLHLLVSESCTFADLADRLRRPTVEETAESVIIALAAESVVRPTLDCPIGGPGAEIEIELQAPLGGRSIVNGLVLPTPPLADQS